jgi:methylated-DNA-[protein]-cysteine S-methyltransferase
VARAQGCCLFDTAIGPCGIAWSAAALAAVQLPETTRAATLARMRRHVGQEVPELAPPAFVQAAVARIQALLEGAHDDLADLPLELGDLPPFHQRVYQVTRAIAPGQVLTYGEVARRVGEPGAARAVGQALGHNPFAPVIPCHRVLAAGGRSGGFSAVGGVDTKLRLLEIEGARFDDEPGLFDEISRTPGSGPAAEPRSRGRTPPG